GNMRDVTRWPRVAATDNEQPGRGKPEKQPIGEYHVRQELIVRVGRQKRERHGGLKPKREDRRVILRVEAPRAREEEAVCSHGVVQARPGKNHDRQEPKTRNDDEQRDEPGTSIAGDSARHVGRKRRRPSDLVWRQNPQASE